MRAEINNSHVEIVEDYDELSKFTGSLLRYRFTQPDVNLGLVPTGTTPIGPYAHLQKAPEDVFKGVILANFDEYCVSDGNGGFRMISPYHPQSFHSFMKRHLYSTHKRIPSLFPNTANIVSPGFYDDILKNLGGVDLCLNAIGEDGHTFGFNQPPPTGSPEAGELFSSVTRLVELNDSTKSVNQKLTGAPVPAHAITTGIATGMASREVITIVSGFRKSEILAKAIYGPVTPEVPASILQQHDNCLWVVDKAAAVLLK